MDKKILGCSIGSCVHVAGVVHFLELASDEGYETFFIGPAVTSSRLIKNIEDIKPGMVCLGYRLTPENLAPLLDEIKELSPKLSYKPKWVFGGTRPCAKIAADSGLFDVIFDSTEDLDDCIALLRGVQKHMGQGRIEGNVIKRMEAKRPYPLLRHHFGLPTMESTIKGIEKIAESGVLDVISLGPDQNSQEFFFEPEKRNPMMDGAGGVPVRSAEDFKLLKQASQRGNYPLMRSYSGTEHVIRLAQVLKDTIDNAWCATSLCWFNELDCRGTRPIERSIQEAQQLMAWHGERNIPLEANEPHHWGLRDAHDTISVAMSYISALNAKAYGVKDFISQYMFNVPNALSFSMDLAKVLAQIELTESLSDDSFKTYRQTRAGLPFLSSDTDVAKGQLAASTYLQMAVNPDIIHVVGYSEAEHAATPEVVIESVKIVRGVVRSILKGGVSYSSDEKVIQRKEELISEANYLINFIRDKYSHIKGDPLTNSDVIADCIRTGILDAPHIVKCEKFTGTLKTRIIDGKCLAYDTENNRPISESERLSSRPRKSGSLAV